MSYDFQWIVPGRVIYIHAEGMATEDEVLSHDQRMEPFLAEVGTERFHVVLDVQDTTGMPPFGAFRKVQWSRDPRLGFFVITGISNQLGRFSASVITQMIGLNYRFAATVPDALKLMNEMDTSLPNLLEAAREKAIV